ncbi:ABC transporter permease [Spirochaeta africana]|uniref:Transport permease protein n=1 Tax=Spirochaeta africana (strain ATCC 700263 / DSM 8902 / Z-7692) TaxID=889378 RepID=H9ULM1_SPIAZ|nr:ABC transporter permease [Spirochaeta africana]AFG38414.1 ABC-type multidrug transport system, permease component [Spirochaeta africana DSM 8902]
MNSSSTSDRDSQHPRDRSGCTDQNAYGHQPCAQRRFPRLSQRLGGVWFRHYRVYTRNLISNGLPPFLEPLIFLVGIGLGLGQYIQQMQGIGYLEFLASGLLVTSAMYTASFECTFGTFIRLEFEKVYDGMLAAPMTYRNLLIGEILWAGTKGMFFSLAVLLVVLVFGIMDGRALLLTPLIGAATGLMFGAIGILVTSLVKNINHFNFFFTGLLSPMFFFSGVVFPIENLPKVIQPLAEVFPLTHSVRLVRAAAFGWHLDTIWWDVLYIVVVTIAASALGLRLLKPRLID